MSEHVGINTPVSIIRQSIGAVTQILSGQNIRVYQRGLEARVEYNERTGRAERVVLPYLPDDASEDLILAVQGFLDHEVGHLLFTDNSALMDIGHDNEWLMMQNYLEDPFVEKMMQGKFQGSKRTISLLHDFFIARTIDPAFKKLSPESSPPQSFGVLLPCITRAWHGMPKFQEYMRDKWELVKPIIDKLPADTEERVAAVKCTRDNIQLARDLLDAIMYVPPIEDFDDKEDDDADEKPPVSPDEAKEGGSRSSSGFDGDRSHAETGLIDEEDDEDSSPHVDDEEEDEEDEAPDMPEMPDAPDPDDADDTAPSFEDEEDRDSEPEGDDADEESPEMPEIDPVDDDSSEDDSDDGSEDDEAIEDIDGEGEGDEEGDGSGSGSSPSVGDDEDTDREEGIDKRMGREEDDSVEEPEPEVESEPEEKPEDVWVPEDDEKLSDYTPGDVEEMLSREISSMGKDAAESADYLIYSTDFDVIEPFKTSGMERKAESGSKRIRALIDGLIGPMQNSLQRALVSRNKSFWRTMQYSGRLNASSLARLTVGDTRVFRRKEETRSKSYDVTLLIDASGSMNHSAGRGSLTRFQTAMVAAYGLGETLHRIGVNFEILGFTTKAHTSAWSDECRRAERKHGVRFGRIDWIYMPIFKSFDERWTPTTMNRIAAAFADGSFLRENVDGECVQLAAQRLMTQKSEGKLLIVLSDGSPACCSSNYASLSRHLRRSVQVAERSGIKVVGVGVDTEVVRSFYDDYIVLNDVTKLPTEVVDQLQRVLLS